MEQNEKFALVLECGSQNSWSVPVKYIHNFDKANHTPLQAYKFDLDGDVLYGTISFIASK